jgi:hypothetical protein
VPFTSGDATGAGAGAIWPVGLADCDICARKDPTGGKQGIMRPASR